MNYTDKYLITDITKKAFKLKYNIKSKKAKKRERIEKKRCENQKRPFLRTKKERQEWWRNLTSDQQAAQIGKWQAQKAKRRESEPERVLRYNPKYPWMTGGVNDSNREQWLATIHKKNPWLKVA